MKKLLKILLAKPVKFINRMVLGLYLRLVKGKARSISKLDLKEKRILVFAPHQDDEVLGCGCMIKQALEQKGHVKCIYMTDGSQSLSEELTPQELVELRKVEALRLAGSWGMEEPIFIGCPDGQLIHDDEGVARRIADVIERYRPDAVFIPYFLDGHRDHTAVSGIYLASVKQLEHPKEFETYCYEINSPISVYGLTHYIDCTGYLRAKKEALDFYSSQTMSFESIFEMNHLNRIITDTEEGAELFRKVELETYETVYNRYNKHNEVSSCFKQMYSIYFMIPAYFKGLGMKKEAAMLQNSGLTQLGG